MENCNLIEEHDQKGMYIRKEVKNMPKQFSRTKTHQGKKQETFEDGHGYKLRYYLAVYLHRGQNSKQINIAKYVSKFLIFGAKMLDKCVKSVFFSKVKLSKIASIKTNKIKKQTVLF